MWCMWERKIISVDINFEIITPHLLSNRFFWACSPFYRCRTSDSRPSMIVSNKIKSKKMRHLRRFMTCSSQNRFPSRDSSDKHLHNSYWVWPWLDDLVSADKHSQVQNPDHNLRWWKSKIICGGSIMLALTVRNSCIEASFCVPAVVVVFHEELSWCCRLSVAVA